MFRNLKTRKVNKSSLYRIHALSNVPQLDDNNLWDLPRPEYLAYNYPDMVLSIIEVHKTISYERIKEILKEFNIPTDLGYVLTAIDTLILQNKIKKLQNYTYTLIIPE